MIMDMVRSSPVRRSHCKFSLVPYAAVLKDRLSESATHFLKTNLREVPLVRARSGKTCLEGKAVAELELPPHDDSCGRLLASLYLETAIIE